MYMWHHLACAPPQTFLLPLWWLPPSPSAVNSCGLTTGRPSISSEPGSFRKMNSLSAKNRICFIAPLQSLLLHISGSDAVLVAYASVHLATTTSRSRPFPLRYSLLRLQQKTVKLLQGQHHGVSIKAAGDGRTCVTHGHAPAHSHML